MTSILWLILFIFLYFLYTRFLRIAYTIWFYRRQNIPFHKGFLPFFGHFLEIIKFERRYKPDIYPVISYITHEFGEQPPAFTGIVFAVKPCLIVNRPEAIHDLFVTKNKFFDKHYSTA